MRAGQHAAWLREVVLDAVALILPVECAGCGLPDRDLCSDCRDALRSQSLVLPGGFPIVAGARYERELRAVILAFKDGDRPGLARALAPLFAAALEGALRLARVNGGGGDTLVLCPIPSRARAVRRRGFRPVERLAAAAGVRGERLLVPAPHARGGSQKSFGASERAENTRGAFRVTGRARGRHVVLLDDVVTTGATLREAARELERAGAIVAAAAVLAATPRRIPNPKETPTELPPSPS